MRTAQTGDRDSYRALLDDIAQDVQSFLRRILRDEQDAEDACQDTLLALHRYRHTYDPARPFEPWLYAVARNVSRTHLERRRVRRRHEERPDVLPEQAVDLDHGFERRVRAGIASLSPEQREAVVLVKLDGHSVEEAAKRAGTTAGALKVRIHRAYKMLKRVLEA